MPILQITVAKAKKKETEINALPSRAAGENSGLIYQQNTQSVRRVVGVLSGYIFLSDQHGLILMTKRPARERRE